MAKWKRTKVGSVLKDKNDPKKFYIKFNKECNFNQNDCLSLESKEDQLSSLEDAFAAGKLKDEEMVNEIRERIQKIPDFVEFEMIKVENVG